MSKLVDVSRWRFNVLLTGILIQPDEKVVKYSQMKTVAAIPGPWPTVLRPTPTPIATPRNATAMIPAVIINSGRRPTLSTNKIDAEVESQKETAFAVATNRAVN
jgi:hypothetical protein